MERNRRIAKAYLRTSSVSIDGSYEEFDGQSCYALPNTRQPTEIGLKRKRSEARLQPLEVHQAVKVFDMRAFKSAVEYEFQQPYPDRKKLLFKSVLRISLVKKEPHPLKTPCWLFVINLVALEVLNSKLWLIRTRLSCQMKCISPFFSRPYSDWDLRFAGCDRRNSVSSVHSLYSFDGNTTSEKGDDKLCDSCRKPRQRCGSARVNSELYDWSGSKPEARYRHSQLCYDTANVCHSPCGPVSSYVDMRNTVFSDALLFEPEH
ncbi:unnamed protein product [Soboliphyme baturini]|uniref:MH2 domain-containing protein n=1 Tax=Soboliphyme baturini TaxID=241478 RepID=A0A183IGR0_9BILA|nr:unnamed protein product [Soboliphyme baturini]